jgi:hypothetical protein
MTDTRHTYRRWLATAGTGLVLLGLAGCGSDRTYPVRGQLLYDYGRPIQELSGSTITFTSPKLGKSATGTIEGDGSFRLTTLRPNDGAYPGTYQVVINQPHPNAERRETRKPAVDVAYEDPQRSKLEATVEPKDNEFTFKLHRFKQ